MIHRSLILSKSFVSPGNDGVVPRRASRWRGRIPRLLGFAGDSKRARSAGVSASFRFGFETRLPRVSGRGNVTRHLAAGCIYPPDVPVVRSYTPANQFRAHVTYRYLSLGRVCSSTLEYIPLLTEPQAPWWADHSIFSFRMPKRRPVIENIESLPSKRVYVGSNGATPDRQHHKNSSQVKKVWIEKRCLRVHKLITIR
jgi:hypothetical protein